MFLCFYVLVFLILQYTRRTCQKRRIQAEMLLVALILIIKFSNYSWKRVGVLNGQGETDAEEGEEKVGPG